MPKKGRKKDKPKEMVNFTSAPEGAVATLLSSKPGSASLRKLRINCESFIGSIWISLAIFILSLSP